MIQQDLQNAIATMHKMGFTLQESDLIFDGRWHRDKTEDHLTYIANKDVTPYGVEFFRIRFHDWRTNFSDTIQSQKPKVGGGNDYEVAMMKMSGREQQEVTRSQMLAAEKARATFNSASREGENAYMKNKRIDRLYGARISQDGSLLVPTIKLPSYEMVGYQEISPAGSKLFQSGQEVTGCSFTIAESASPNFCYVVEGFATWVSIHKATGKTVVCAFSAGNLQPVCEMMKTLGYTIVVCADNDRFKTRAGEKAAINIKRKLKIDFVLPQFPEGSTWGTDFNDLEIQCGISEVRAQILGEKPEAKVDLTKWDEYLKNGFHDLVPKTNAKGEELEDSNGQPIMKQVPNYDALAKYLQEAQHGCSINNYVYLYKDNHYAATSDQELKFIIDKLLLDKRDPDITAKFARAATIKLFRPQEFFEAPSGIINLANGELHVEAKQLKPHNSRHFFLYKLPHDFNPNVECPEWMDYLDFIFSGNDGLARLSAEIFGYILEGGYPWLHKAFILQGSGRNGKSTWLDVMKYMIGSNNYSTVPVGHLDKPFSVIMTRGKLANIVGEFEKQHADSEAFKKYVAGEEVIAAQKGKDEFSMLPTARLVFATNNIPTMRDASDGYFERLCVIPFERQIPRGDRIPNFWHRFRPEISGIINWALDGLERLKDRGRLLDVDAADQSIEDYKLAADSVYQYVTEHIFPAENKDLTEEKARANDVLVANTLETSDKLFEPRRLFRHYQAWCDANGRASVGSNSFTSRLILATSRKKISVAIISKRPIVKLTGRFWMDTSACDYYRSWNSIKAIKDSQHSV